MSETSSTSVVTGNSYTIPSGHDLDDLSHFIKNNKNQVVVAVQGLGFVGTVMSLVIANSDNAEYAVVGVDRATEDSYWKIAEINAGICPIVSSDPLVSEFFENTKAKRNFYATYDPKAFSFADVIIIDINLDVTKVKDGLGNIKSYDVPLEPLKKQSNQLARYAKKMF